MTSVTFSNTEKLCSFYIFLRKNVIFQVLLRQADEGKRVFQGTKDLQSTFKSLLKDPEGHSTCVKVAVNKTQYQILGAQEVLNNAIKNSFWELLDVSWKYICIKSGYTVLF